MTYTAGIFPYPDNGAARVAPKSPVVICCSHNLPVFKDKVRDGVAFTTKDLEIRMYFQSQTRTIAHVVNIMGPIYFVADIAFRFAFRKYDFPMTLPFLAFQESKSVGMFSGY